MGCNQSVAAAMTTAAQRRPPPLLPADTGSLLTLQGAGAYDAAVHCASVSAARRLTSPGPSRTTSALSDMHGAVPGTPPPLSPAGLAPMNSGFPSPESSEGMDEASGSSGGGSAANKRRLSGLGRKLRTALSDLLR